MKLQKISILLLACIFSLSLMAQTQKYSRVKVHLKEKDISVLAKAGVTIENGKIKNKEYFIGEISENEIGIIKKIGLSYDVQIDDMSKFYRERNKNPKGQKIQKAALPYIIPAHFKHGSMGGFLTYAEMLQELDSMRILYPSLISVKQPIGLQATVEGRQQLFVKISDNPDQDESEPEVLYSALTHAREPAGMQQMIFYMYYLLENYNSDPEVKYLVDNLEMYFVPCVNPDGYEFNYSSDPLGGGMWRKNRLDNGDGSYGIDLNRNYGYNWGYDDQGSSPDGYNDTYRGTAGFSEIETQMMKYFCELRDFKMIIDYHCYSNVLITPWGYADLVTPDTAIYRPFATLMTSENNFLWGTPYQTIGYNANGTSCDWFYGEQNTKPKIIAFSPEAGSMDDGFWPMESNIDNICVSNMGMNLYLARLALRYAVVNDLSSQFIQSQNGFIKFNIKCLGLDIPADFTISIAAISPEIINVGTDKTFLNMVTLDNETDSIDFTLSSGITAGQHIKFLLSVNNGLFTYADTLTKIYGQPQILFTDNGENLSHWTSATGWNVTASQYHSPSKSITDSPGGSYSTSPVNSSVTTIQAVSLINTSAAFLSYWAKWDLNTDQDYVQIKISTNNGTSWIPLQCQHTNMGVGGNQPLNQPLYDGTQSNWVQENIDISIFAGQNVKFRFTLKSPGNNYPFYDGFYFDDFAVTVIPSTFTDISIEKQKSDFFMFPNPASETLNIRFTEVLKNQECKFIIYNSIGTIVKHGKLFINSNIDVSSLNQGIYFIKLESFCVSAAMQRFAVVK